MHMSLWLISAFVVGWLHQYLHVLQQNELLTTSCFLFNGAESLTEMCFLWLGSLVFAFIHCFLSIPPPKKIPIKPVDSFLWLCGTVSDRCGDWGPFFKVPPPSSLCCSLSDDKKLLIQVPLSGTARVATIVAALKDIQVAELVTSGVLEDYSATSEGACWLGETGEQPVALKQQGTYSQSPG